MRPTVLVHYYTVNRNFERMTLGEGLVSDIKYLEWVKMNQIVLNEKTVLVADYHTPEVFEPINY